MADLNKLFAEMNLDSPTQGMGHNSHALIVDSTNLFIRNYSAVPSMNEDGQYTGGVVGFLKSLALAVRSFKPTRVILVFDGKGGSQRRRKLFPQYKENRKPPIRLNRSYDMTTEQEEHENMKFQLVSLIEILENLPVTIMARDNVEADDVIAHVSQLIASEGGKSIIYSTDKDFLQLVSEEVIVYNPVKKKTFDINVVLNDYGIHPRHFVFYRALDGDVSDNIAGIKGVGLKTLLKYLPELSDPTIFIDHDYVVNKFSDQKKIPKVIQEIINNKDIISRNMQLMNLSEGMMSADTRLKVSDTFNEHHGTLKKMDLTKALIRLKMIGSFSNYDLWVQQSFVPLTRFTKGIL